ncbi:MAG: hypothetical protein ACLQVJ_15355 [Syntrophobacteraceae bacterium]
MRGKKGNGHLTFAHLETLVEKDKSASSESATTENLLTLDESAAWQIRQALQTTKGRISGPYGAAQLLGMMQFHLDYRGWLKDLELVASR